MQYFEGLTNEEEIKARYKELAKKYHPDLGGDLEVMKVVNAQYEQVITGMYQRAGKSITEIDELLAKDSVMREKLRDIILLNDLMIELCGNWLWVTGNTKDHKEKLKEAKFRWSPNKGAWYWRAEGKRSWNRKPMGLDEIRYKHGTLSVKATPRTRIGV